MERVVAKALVKVVASYLVPLPSPSNISTFAGVIGCSLLVKDSHAVRSSYTEGAWNVV